MQDPHEEYDASTIHEVRTLRLPQPFWRENPARYFTVAEMTFALHRVTSDDTKYRHIIIHLDPDLLGLVGDIIDSPPTVGKYEAIKQRIINSLSESKEAGLRRLIRGQAMGDDKPSVYLQRLRNLAGGQCNDNVLRTLFMEQMPEQVRGILAIGQLEDLTTLAAQADRIIEVTRPQVASINCDLAATVLTDTRSEELPRTISSIGNNSREISELRRAIDVLTKRFDQAFMQQETRSRSRSRGGHRGRAFSPRNRDGQKRVCYYHRKFGDGATKCAPPCAWIAGRTQDKGN